MQNREYLTVALISNFPCKLVNDQLNCVLIKEYFVPTKAILAWRIPSPIYHYQKIVGKNSVCITHVVIFLQFNGDCLHCYLVLQKEMVFLILLLYLDL